jgi:hypothetical protein
MGLTRRHFAVSLVEKDGHLKCPGGGIEHPLDVNVRLFHEGAAWSECHTCKKIVFMLHQKYGVVNVWEIEPHEALMMEREHMTDPRKILEYLNRGAKRLDRV